MSCFDVSSWMESYTAVIRAAVRYSSAVYLHSRLSKLKLCLCQSNDRILDSYSQRWENGHSSSGAAFKSFLLMHGKIILLRKFAKQIHAEVGFQWSLVWGYCFISVNQGWNALKECSQFRLGLIDRGMIQCMTMLVSWSSILSPIGYSPWRLCHHQAADIWNWKWNVINTFISPSGRTRDLCWLLV